MTFFDGLFNFIRFLIDLDIEGSTLCGLVPENAR
jgi:hypothetical protein